MLDPKKIRNTIKENISCMLDMDCTKPNYEEDLNKAISQMDIIEALNYYLEYEGIHGYTRNIVNAYENIKKAEISKH